MSHQAMLRELARTDRATGMFLLWIIKNYS